MEKTNVTNVSNAVGEDRSPKTLYSKKLAGLTAYFVFMSQSPNAVELSVVVTKAFIVAVCIQGVLDLVKCIVEYRKTRKQV